MSEKDQVIQLKRINNRIDNVCFRLDEITKVLKQIEKNTRWPDIE